MVSLESMPEKPHRDCCRASEYKSLYVHELTQHQWYELQSHFLWP